MNLARWLLMTLLVLVAPCTLARPVIEGVYGQTWASPEVGQCAACEVRIKKITPHIVELTSNNGWSGFAYYIPREDRYQGTFEWWAGEGGPYDRVLFVINLKFDGQTLTMNATSEALTFVATYRRSTPAQRETAL